MAETGIQVKDIAYGRLRAPDLDVMEEFLVHFGLSRVDRTGTKLFMRGTDPAHHIHITELGEPSFIGFGYHARSMEDLHRLAHFPEASAVEAIDEPGGGWRTTLTEPNGYKIEVIFGQAEHEPVTYDPLTYNLGHSPLARTGTLQRLSAGPPLVKRLGHGVLGSPDVRGTTAWFRDRLGFVGSDDMYDGAEDNILGSFNRIDAGEDFVDHHVFFCIIAPHAGLNHLAFEVHDVDAVMAGHSYLSRLGKYEQMWGVGRHLLGSQIFDYWADPWGRMHEHWTDSDRLNTMSPPVLVTWEEGNSSQWGEPPPQRFRERVSP